ncbi:hypothetical protein MUP59_00350, partial [Candidatus Bathyarchaeota archaeon]|nr:hypothetical protein [Candidatus Bathyarchaeota archaeon]
EDGKQLIRNSWVIDDKHTLRENSKLRKGGEPTEWALKIDKLCNSKFKEDSEVYRGAALTKKVIDNIINTNQLTDLGFMSVSGDKSLSEFYLGERMRDKPGTVPVMFHLRVPKGSRVGVMDMGEFTFPRGTRIKIIDWTLTGGRYDISGEVETP